MSSPERSQALYRALTALTLGLALAIAACDRLPADAPARVTEGIEAAGRGDHAEAYWLWRPLADAGMAEAQYHLGWLYANGSGLLVDVPEAILWWERAAAAGNTDAEFAIGMAYLNGETRTLKKDFGRAVEWLARAAGHASADAREILERLVRSETDRVIAAGPGILAENWLGTPVRSTTDTAALLEKPASGAKTLAKISRGTLLRRIDERKGWLLVVLPGTTGVGWIAAKDVEPVAAP